MELAAGAFNTSSAPSGHLPLKGKALDWCFGGTFLSRERLWIGASAAPSPQGEGFGLVLRRHLPLKGRFWIERFKNLGENAARHNERNYLW